MNKPTQYDKSAIDFLEAKKWVNTILGYDIRDVNDCAGQGYNADVPYLDYWHYITDFQNVSNGGTIYISSEMNEDCEDWQKEITECFVGEFGEDQAYWTEW